VIFPPGVLSAMSLLLLGGEPAIAPLNGPYVLQLEPAPACHAPVSSYSFRVSATSADGRRPAVRVLPANIPIAKPAAEDLEPLLEMELLYAGRTLVGGIATMPWQDAGVRADEGTYLWIQGIASGTVVVGARRAEVWEGTMVADLSFGRDFDDRDGLGQCKGAAGRWSLRAR
jgi:hypothetical protein